MFYIITASRVEVNAPILSNNFISDTMMWLDEGKRRVLGDSDDDSVSSGEEVPIWVRGEQRWVSGITGETTCQDVIQVLLHDEESRGRHIGLPEQYHITERWRGVEQPLDRQSVILDIWNAWGTAQPEVKISLRRIKYDRPPSRRTRCRSDSSTWSDRSAWKTIHPKRLHALQNEKQPSSTEELLKLVLAQGEVIRRQLKKLRHSEHQIGYLEDKTHKARVRKHGSNYLLETYLKGLSEAVDPENDANLCADKNSDSGVMTEGDSEQSNTKSRPAEQTFERFSPSSEEFSKDIKDDDTSSTVSEATIREQIELFESIAKLNKRLLKEEESLVRLDANLKKYDKHKTDDLAKALTNLRTEMTKSACEMQHNEVVLEETMEMLLNRRHYLENLHRDLANEEQEHEMLQALMFSTRRQRHNPDSCSPYYSHTKELLDTLV
ncbi:hypothetical protein TcasGA2_TC007083 [Tribolium castaneum]|uniref:Apoptosis-stimulating of p53 protein 2-like RA domain-containing protein n=1 Tax=Tribolium castaneum TaxID=7070 RepID=A0A139WJK6_TRICA|nr:hypothetical protein TcasGA2_TC007083 [Tribolium castaneum]